MHADLSITEITLNVLFSYIWHIHTYIHIYMYVCMDTVAMHKLSVMGLIKLNFLCCRICAFGGDVCKWTR